MKEQKLILKEIKSFTLKDIFECGQCFRWNREQDGSYTGVFGKNVLNLKKEKQTITIEGICEKNIKSIVEEYFDLDRDYEVIKHKLSKIDQTILSGKKVQNARKRIIEYFTWESTAKKFLDYIQH